MPTMCQVAGTQGWALWAVRTFELSNTSRCRSLLPVFTEGSSGVRVVVTLLRSHS